MKARRTLALIPMLALSLGSLSVGGTAQADPKKGDVFTITCNGTDYEIAVNGRGDFTPAHDTASTAVLVPHAFGDFTGTIYDTEGAMVDTFTEAGFVKGSGKQKGDVVCTYVFTYVSDGSTEAGFPAGYTFIGEGSAIGKLTGRR